MIPRSTSQASRGLLQRTRVKCCRLILELSRTGVNVDSNEIEQEEVWGQFELF
jgi:hypothetical protein